MAEYGLGNGFKGKAFIKIKLKIYVEYYSYNFYSISECLSPSPVPPCRQQLRAVIDIGYDILKRIP